MSAPTQEATARLGLWEGFGVEVEYMIVDAGTLSVRPVADLLISAAAGEEGASDVDRGPVAWSNELALHVLELKTNGPPPSLAGLAGRFQASVEEANEHLEHLGARLLAGGMHPWMDPQAELRLWPHEYNEVYRAFDRIFGCRGHGWANLQSTHVNLPWRDDDELFRLHEAVRLVLPLIPALAASSPVLEGRVGPALDNRLLAYRDNARWIPSVTGRVVPERIRSEAEYRERILGRIYDDMEPVDPEGVLRHEWVNARGATVRFDRGAIEIRVIDSQESAGADVAVAAAVVGAVRWLAEGPLRDLDAAEAEAVDMDTLVGVLERTTHEGERARVDSPPYRTVLGMEGASSPSAAEVWGRLVEAGARTEPAWEEWAGPLNVILTEGPLARRILRSLEGGVAEDGTVDHRRLRDVVGRLADCMRAGEVFRAGDV